MSESFISPDWNSALDPEPNFSEMPANALSRGMFFTMLLREVKQHSGRELRGYESKSYIAFKNYSLREFMEALLLAAKQTYPLLSVREALRRFGRGNYTTLVENSSAAKVIFNAAGRNLSTALSLASRAYALSLDPGSAKATESGPNFVVIELRSIWCFVDAYHIGLVEGFVEAFGHKGNVTIRRLSTCDVDLYVAW
jgi:uncharacterized protein (TIGR02265 family)